ncbi:lyase family protein [Turicimonas muris]|uniref:lyase family protein n=1 Tax=Turicimonas muris TaxID=1796652 RepID=UPI0024951FC6|nr:lyase family protein [Turicimonas muris]
MRLEKDSLGTLEVPDNAYYGIQTVRCAANHNVTNHTFCELPRIQRALAEIKKACALTNQQIGALEKVKAEVIVQACDEIIAGKFQDQFPINIWRSHGTGANMNVNEIIANRANEILTGHKGYEQVHPNTHVNMCQSSNDVYPTVQSIVLYRQIGEALESVQLLEDALGDKAKEFKNIVRLGRTCLQDAVPNTFGQVFGGWKHMIHRLKNRLADYRDEYTSVVLGATVLGTGMGQMPGYSEHIMDNLSQVLGWKVQWPSWEEEVIQDSAAFDGMQNCDHSLVLAGLLKALCCAAGRISKDLCILSSGPKHGFGEINLPQKANEDSSSVPQLMFEIMQQSIVTDQAATLTVNENDSDEAITDSPSFMGLMETLDNITEGFKIFAEDCISGITVNEEKVNTNAEMSTSLATMVSALFGYQVGTRIAHRAWNEGISCREAALEENLLTQEQANDLFDIQKLTDREALVQMFAKYGSLRNIK